MKKKNDKKKKVVLRPQSAYPTEWLYFHGEELTVQQLRDYFRTLPGVDVECWGDLGVLELTFASKRYIDFERAALPLGEADVDAFAAAHEAKSLYMVSAEPVCTEEELDFLRETAQKLGGWFVVDNEGMEPV